ncbi:MAG: hypothetical protein ACYC9K_04115 [Sulfuricaulis sp.]
MPEKKLIHPARLIGVFFFFLLMAGCAGVERTSPQSSTPGAVAIEPSMAHPAEPSVVKAEAPEIKTATMRPAQRPVKKPGAAPSPEKQQAAPPLDLKALETRLKDTKAIGVFTKIALKNQVDDLLNQFRAYYQGRVKTTLSALRQPYELLILKVLALLQDGDPGLAHAIVASREAIWNILSDRTKFATL